MLDAVKELFHVCTCIAIHPIPVSKNIFFQLRPCFDIPCRYPCPRFCSISSAQLSSAQDLPSSLSVSVLSVCGNGDIQVELALGCRLKKSQKVERLSKKCTIEYHRQLCGFNAKWVNAISNFGTFHFHFHPALPLISHVTLSGVNGTVNAVKLSPSPSRQPDHISWLTFLPKDCSTLVEW